MPRFSNKVFKRRKNVGRPKVVYVGSDCSSSNNPSPSTPMPEPISPEPLKESLSSKKLSISLTEYSDYKGDSSFNDIVNIKSLQNLLSQIVVCAQCRSSVSVFTCDRLGLSTNIVVKCNNCGFSVSDINSKVLDSGKTEINVRLVLAFRCIGLGEQAAKQFCGLMNLPRPTEFKPYNKILRNVVKDVSIRSMKEAVVEAVALERMENEENLGLENDTASMTIALDGTWQKRGHASQNGVVSAICVNTGKVVDAEILTKYCRCKNRLEKQHENNCVANYQGSSGGMEVAGVINIFQRSEEIHNVRYDKYLGDGDTAAYATIAGMKPYGLQCNIEKLECVGHVQKRMGTRLRTLKTKLGKNKLSDGKTIGGQGRLTGSAIQQITTYYGLAIRRNTNSLTKMKQAVWALYFHLISCDSEPAHGLCPKDEDTWCKYQKSMINKEKYIHKDHFHLPVVIMSELKPIFKDLSKPELLKRCLHGGTQNPSESLNNMIWARLPKRTFVMMTTLELGVFDAIAVFNKGNIVRCEVLAKLGIVPGENCVKALQDMDKLRVKKANKAIEEIAKKCRRQTTLARKKLEDTYEAAEDPNNPAYGAGMH